MANSRQVVLGVAQGKKSAVRSSAGAADANVIVQYDREANQADVIATLEKIRELIIEQEYRTDV